MNYRPMLDSIKKVLAADKQNSSSSKNVKALQLTRLARALSSAKASGMKMVSQSNSEVILEMEIENAGEPSLPWKLKSSVQRKAVMKFTSDMNRMLEQKIYENNQLVQSVTYEYQADNGSFTKKATATVSSFLPGSSVRAVTYKSLALKNSGVPYVMVKQERYKKNQLEINL
jgi:hypothetical protein